MATLKPFVLNLSDLDFLYKHVKFRGLFDADGNAIINWNGVGDIFNGRSIQIGTGGIVAGDAASLAAIQTFGTSYASVSDFSGLRDVSGLNNNLLKVNADWGSVDQPFTRTVAANFDGYLKPLVASDPDAFYGAKQFSVDTNPNVPGLQNDLFLTNYDTVVNNIANDSNPLTSDTNLGNGLYAHQQNVVDYTARMISQVVTTGGATPLLDGAAGHAGGGHIVTWNPGLYDTDSIYAGLIDAAVARGEINTATLVEGTTIVTDYGMLKQLGHVDYQKPPGTPGSDEYFIGAENPGVAPTNSWFAYFGQFFDHGLDLIGKGGQGKTIKIALATDDPLYGQIGPDGRPATSVTISRASISGADANGDPEYINHTSPFIDQSQTYGSHLQMNSLLREWVSSDNGATFHLGMKLFDGHTLATPWQLPDGTMTTQTLPSLNELRDHVLDTNRAALTWEDVLDLRNRGTNGELTGGNSGQALLLDMNNRFDADRLDNMTAVGTSTVDALVDAAVATLAGAVPPGFAFGRTGVDGLSGNIQLTVSGGAGGPHLPNGTYTGASALALWVNFSDFSIKASVSPAVKAAVSEILMASVGDHYIAGDGRVNENIGLTTIHHVFHEEHNFQITNVINTIYAQDAAVSPLDHAQLYRWQINTGVTDANGNFIHANEAGTADDVIAWDQEALFQAAKLVVEMEYQHAAVDQYARSITPHIQEFVGYSSGIDSTITLEYAQSAFRFGHSTIRETIDYIDPTGGITGKVMSYALQKAFLNPALFAETGPAALALGMSHQQMNEVDEFITPALNQGLLDLPLDLASMNIARGRDLGIPTLNEFRGAVGLTQYVSWDDFAQNMIHPESLVNFIAAYAFDGNVARAQAIMGLADGSLVEGTPQAMGYTADQAMAFMYNDSSLAAAAAAAQALANTTDAVALDAIADAAESAAAAARLAATNAANADAAAVAAQALAVLTDAVALDLAAGQAETDAVAARLAATNAANADAAAVAAQALADLTNADALLITALGLDGQAADAHQLHLDAIANGAVQAVIDALLATAQLLDNQAANAHDEATAAALADQAALDAQTTADLTDAVALDLVADGLEADAMTKRAAATAAAQADQAALDAQATADLTDAVALDLVADGLEATAATARAAADAAVALDVAAAAAAALAADAAAFNLIDTWIGGLAEAHVPGGLLGSTFDLVFTNQIESLMDGDRYYYLFRLFGEQFGEEVNNGQFKDIVERNTGLRYLNGSVLSYADQYYDFRAMDSGNDQLGDVSHKAEHKYGEILALNPTLGIWSDLGASINGNGSIMSFDGRQYIRDFRPEYNPGAMHPVEGTPTTGATSPGAGARTRATPSKRRGVRPRSSRSSSTCRSC